MSAQRMMRSLRLQACRTKPVALAAGVLLVALTADGAVTDAAMPPDVPSPAVVDAGLLARYEFEDCATSDTSDNGFDGVAEGSLDCVPGVSGDAAAYDGGGFVAVAADVLGATATQSRTISLWARPTSVPFEYGAAGLISKYRHYDVAQSNFYAALYQWTDGTMIARLTANGTNSIDVPGGTLNEWQHFTFVLAAGADASAIYLDGRLLATGTLNFNEVFTAEPLRIGNTVGDSDQVFRGDLDDVRIYDRVLKPHEIRWLARGRPPYGPTG